MMEIKIRRTEKKKKRKHSVCSWSCNYEEKYFLFFNVLEKCSSTPYGVH